MVGIQPQQTTCRLATRHTHGSRLYTVIHRIPDQMHQRITDFFHHRFINLGITTGNFQLYVLTQFHTYIAHHTLEAAEGGTDRHHTQLQCTVTYFLDQTHHFTGRFEQGHIMIFTGPQIGTGTRNHQFTDQINQLIQPLGVDAYALALSRLLFFDLLLLIQCCIQYGRLQHFLINQNFTYRHLRCITGLSIAPLRL